MAATIEGRVLPEDVFIECGGLNEYGEAKNPQEFVKYCQKRLQEMEGYACKHCGALPHEEGLKNTRTSRAKLIEDKR